MTVLAPFATASILFWVPTGDLETPLGNPTTETVPLVVLAYLRAGGYGAQQTVDGQVSGQGMTGRLIAPGAMPSGVQDGQVGEVIFWRIGDGFGLPETGWATLGDYQLFQATHSTRIATTGEFVWEDIPPGGFGVEAILGDKLSGRFIARSSWTDSI